jgi:ABC-type multidrug transport system ATPase subunit
MTLFKAENIQKRFGARVVLEDISLCVEEGSVHGIMGPNGAGKTTCFHVLSGLNLTAGISPAANLTRSHAWASPVRFRS